MAATTTHDLSEDLKEIQDNLGTIIGTVQDPAALEALQNMISSLSGMTDKLVNSQTTPQTILTKLKSRKFWMALLGAVTGICGMLSSGGNVTAILIFVVLEVISIVGYIFSEGTIDSTRTKELLQMATQIAAIIGSISPMLMDGVVVGEGELPPVNDTDGPAPCTNGTNVDTLACYDGNTTDGDGAPNFEIPTIPAGEE